MNGGALSSIGELARRTGLTVKTVRFYADRGIVPPADRSPAGYRLFDTDAVTRLELVRTLRDLGLDLATIRRVVDREASLPEVAAAHAEALAVQIRVLRLRRAVSTAVARRGSSPEEMDLMHRLARLSETERGRLIEDFLGAVLGGADDDPEFAGVRRSLTPELPDDPTDEQILAWADLAELSQDPDFRAGVRRMTRDYAADRSDSRPQPRPDLVALIRDQAGPSATAGLDPSSRQAGRIVAAIVEQYAHDLGCPPDDDLRCRLAARLETANDPRWQRYLRLLAVVNGWPAPEAVTPALNWFVEALSTPTSALTRS